MTKTSAKFRQRAERFRRRAAIGDDGGSGYLRAKDECGNHAVSAKMLRFGEDSYRGVDVYSLYS